MKDGIDRLVNGMPEENLGVCASLSVALNKERRFETVAYEFGP